MANALRKYNDQLQYDRYERYSGQGRPAAANRRRSSGTGAFSDAVPGRRVSSRSTAAASGRQAPVRSGAAGQRKTSQQKNPQQRNSKQRNPEQQTMQQRRYSHQLRPTPRQREEMRRRAMVRQRRAEKRRRAWMARFLALAGLLASVFLIFRGFAAVIHFIDSSRQQNIDAMQETFYANQDNGAYVESEAVSAEVQAAGGDGQAAAGGEMSADTVGSEAAMSAQTAQGTSTGFSQQTETSFVSAGRVIDRTRPMIALTFDDGPNPSVGNRIMDALEASGGRGTFFMVGDRVHGAESELQRMAEKGHELANHSYDHDLSLSGKGAEYIASEFDKASDAIQSASGVRPASIRLPGGKISDTVRFTLQLPMFYWSLDTRDWKTRDTQAVIDAIRGHVQDGDIVLMHELYDTTAAAMEVMIPELVSQGYQLVTVSELVEARGLTGKLQLGKQYECFRPAETQPQTEAQTQADAQPQAQASAEGSASPEMPAESTAAA